MNKWYVCRAYVSLSHMFSSICSRVICRNKSDFNHVDDDTQATTWRIESQMEGALLTKDAY